MASCPRCIRGFLFRGNCVQCGYDTPEVAVVIHIPAEYQRGKLCARCGKRRIRVTGIGTEQRDICYACGKELEVA